MQKRFIAYGLATLLGLPLVVGCPGTTVTPTVPVGSSLKGTIKFNGTGTNGLTVKLKKYDGASWASTNKTAVSTTGGAYSFTDLDNGRYQPYFDDSGEVVQAADVNTTGTYVTEPVDVSSTQTTTPTVDFDVYWPVSPNPAPSATFTVGSQSFSWTLNPNAAGAQYQVLVADSGKSSLWSSSWMTGNSVAWNGNRGSETDSPGGTKVASGTGFYQIKFRKSGGTFLGSNFYGQTKWIPYTLNNP